MASAALADVFRISEFRFIWFAEVLSIAGDQLARVALAVLVYGRTGSASWAAGTYALTFLPAMLGGVLLSGLADRYRRREVMVAADLSRAALVTVMAIPGLPLGLICVVLVLVVLLGSPFAAAQGALLPEILPGDRYERGLAVRQVTSQAAQLVGFGTGGLLVAAVSPGPALICDAVTFVLSGLLIRLGLVDRPPPDAGNATAAADASVGGPRGVAAAMARIAADPRRRALVFLAWMIGWYVVPEALAAPYADRFGAGPSAVGLLMAADPLGSILGVWLFVRFVPDRVRERAVGVLACCAGLPLVLCAFRPTIGITIALWALSGMLSTAYLLQTQVSFVRATPASERGRAVGVAASGIIAAQGVAVLIGGWLADLWEPATAVAVAGAVGSVLCLGGTVAWRSASRTRADTAPIRHT
ncbi:MAG TPA: MFS transporter [Catenuloplanes sp.]|jgi:MFS family permease